MGQVANGRRDKTGSCRATNEVEWVTPTSEASSDVHYSNKHQFIEIFIEKGRVLCLESKIPTSWGVHSPDWLSSQSGNQTRCYVARLSGARCLMLGANFNRCWISTVRCQVYNIHPHEVAQLLTSHTRRLTRVKSLVRSKIPWVGYSWKSSWQSCRKCFEDMDLSDFWMNWLSSILRIG